MSSTFTPASFKYLRAKTIDEALEFLEKYEDSKIIAGGQSLLIMMRFRILTPKHLIDINGIPELKYIKLNDKFINIGALTTHDEIANSPIIKSYCPLLSEAARKVGDQQVRNLGTIGGSVSHADPGANYLPVLVSLGAQVVIKGKTGERIVNAEDFFLGPYQTLLGEKEIVKEVRVPIINPFPPFSFIKFTRREQEFSLCTISTIMAINDSNVVNDIRIGVGAVHLKPVRAKEVEEKIVGKAFSLEVINEAVNSFNSEGRKVLSDFRAGEEYRTHLAKVLIRRSILNAYEIHKGRGKSEEGQH